MAEIALIVEDEPGLLEIYSRVVHDIGFEVLRASNGEEAITLLDANQPAVLLLDILLPRVNGLAVLDHIAQSPHLNHTRIIIVSSNHHFANNVANFPNAVFVVKPIRPAQIRALLS